MVQKLSVFSQHYFSFICNNYSVACLGRISASVAIVIPWIRYRLPYIQNYISKCFEYRIVFSIWMCALHVISSTAKLQKRILHQQNKWKIEMRMAMRSRIDIEKQVQSFQTDFIMTTKIKLPFCCYGKRMLQKNGSDSIFWKCQAQVKTKVRNK